MTDIDRENLDRFEQVLQDGLLKICDGAKMTCGLMFSPDFDDRWENLIKGYVADAVNNINGYPEAAVGFAAFLGMAVANQWDKDWEKFRSRKYEFYYGVHGFDDMDEHILYDFLKLDKDSDTTKKIIDTVQSCASATLGLLEHEQIELQTEYGFYALARCYTVLFRIGASMELKRLGYRNERVNPNTPAS